MEEGIIMYSAEFPPPPKLLLVVVAILAVASLAGMVIGEHYQKDKTINSTAAVVNINRYSLKISVARQDEGLSILKQLNKQGLTGSVETKDITTMVPKGYVVSDFFSKDVGRAAAKALRIYNYKVTIETADKDRVTIRVGEIFADKNQCMELAEQLKARGYLFKVKRYEQPLKKTSHYVVLKKLNQASTELILKELTTQGYHVEKQEE